MARYLDLEGWRRRDHFEFFRDFEQPFWSVCCEWDVTSLLAALPSVQGAFFLATLYLGREAANRVEPFRYRLLNGKVVVQDRVHLSCTVLRQDETFAFGHFDFEGKDFADFMAQGLAEIERLQTADGLDDRPERDDLIYCSVLPWLSFTSFSHARRVPATESAPRIVYGKRRALADGRIVIPVSVEVHHALVDGLDVGRFFEQLEELSASSSPLLLG